jgi:hypothetical protein
VRRVHQRRDEPQFHALKPSGDDDFGFSVALALELLDQVRPVSDNIRPLSLGQCLDKRAYSPCCRCKFGAVAQSSLP